MNVVLDTNVLIAAFIAKGRCHAILEHCLCLHRSITSEFILNELGEKLTEKFKYSQEDAAAAIALLRSKMQIVVPERLDSDVCRDSDDDVILATALAGNAACIITGDKDLLILQKFRNINILSPSEFLAIEERDV